MAFEYIEEIKQENYTLAGVTDENYPLHCTTTVYAKGDYTIKNNIIYECRKATPLATYYVYAKEEDELYIPSEQLYEEEAVFKANSTFENKYIYLDDTTELYKYIGATDLTILPKNIDFTNTSLWESKGKQLNGYTATQIFPNTNPLYWKEVKYINSKRCFDNSNPSQTVGDENTPMVFTFTTSKVDRIALFNLEATKLTVKIHLTGEPEDPSNTQTTEYPLYTRQGTSFYEILTADINLKKTSYLQIPTASIQKITLTLENQRTGIAKIGDLTLGRAVQVGKTLDSVQFDVKEYSTYSSDTEATDKYQEGGYRNISNFNVSFPTKEMEQIKKQLDSRRGKVTVYNLDTRINQDFTQLKGFLRSRPIDYIGNNTKSKINIKIEGRVE